MSGMCFVVIKCSDKAKDYIMSIHKALGASPCKVRLMRRNVDRGVSDSSATPTLCSDLVLTTHLTPFCLHTLDLQPCYSFPSLLQRQFASPSCLPAFTALPLQPCFSTQAIGSSKWHLRSSYSSKILIGSTSPAPSPVIRTQAGSSVG